MTSLILFDSKDLNINFANIYYTGFQKILMVTKLLFITVLSFFLVNCGEDIESRTEQNQTINEDSMSPVEQQNTDSKESFETTEPQSTTEFVEPKKIKEYICQKEEGSNIKVRDGYNTAPFKAIISVYDSGLNFPNRSSLGFTCSVKYEQIAKMRVPNMLVEGKMVHMHFKIGTLKDVTTDFLEIEKCEGHLLEKVNEHKAQGYTCVQKL